MICPIPAVRKPRKFDGRALARLVGVGAPARIARPAILRAIITTEATAEGLALLDGSRDALRSGRRGGAGHGRQGGQDGEHGLHGDGREMQRV